MHQAQSLIDTLELGAVAHRVVADLPFGTQKRVELARALASSPKLLLLDEPAAGLNHDEIEVLKGQIKRVRDTQHVTVLLVEQNVLKALEIADRAYVLEQGRIVSEGLPADLMAQPHIREAYLGV